jgi:hypothetical protein
VELAIAAHLLTLRSSSGRLRPFSKRLPIQDMDAIGAVWPADLGDWTGFAADSTLEGNGFEIQFRDASPPPSA